VSVVKSVPTDTGSGRLFSCTVLSERIAAEMTGSLLVNQVKIKRTTMKRVASEKL